MPPRRRAMRRTSGSPMPRPPSTSALVEKPRAKIDPAICAGTPGPSSLTTRSIVPSASRRETTTSWPPPPRQASTALSTRLPSRVVTSAARSVPSGDRSEDGSIVRRRPASPAWLTFAASRAATAGSRTASRSAESSSARSWVRVPSRFASSSYSPSSTSPEIVCRRFANSCVWARSASLIDRFELSCCSTSTTSVRSRIVVTPPMPRPRLDAVRRLTTRTWSPVSTTAS